MKMAFNEIEDKYLQNKAYLPGILVFWPVIFCFSSFFKWLKEKKQKGEVNG